MLVSRKKDLVRCTLPRKQAVNIEVCLHSCVGASRARKQGTFDCRDPGRDGRRSYGVKGDEIKGSGPHSALSLRAKTRKLQRSCDWAFREKRRLLVTSANVQQICVLDRQIVSASRNEQTLRLFDSPILEHIWIFFFIYFFSLSR